MTDSILHSPLRGIVPPMITPLAESGDGLDVPGLERLVEHLIGGGVHGLFLLGTTGEGISLPRRVARELVRRTCRLVRERVPVLVAVTDTRVSNSIAMGRWAAKVGASAVVVSTPYYLPLEQEEVIGYVRAVVGGQPLPVFLYNIPQLTKTAFELETVMRLAEAPRIMGIKDTSGNPAYLPELQRRITRSDWSFLVGNELHLSETVLGGGHGSVCGGSNVEPRTFVALYEAAVRRDLEAIARLKERVVALNRAYRPAPGNALFIRHIKCALACMGICSGRMTEPFRSATPEERNRVNGLLVELGLVQR
jgi:4-hydroxy-tetrahydrodipicolinate synthase